MSVDVESFVRPFQAVTRTIFVFFCKLTIHVQNMHFDTIFL